MVNESAYHEDIITGADVMLSNEIWRNEHLLRNYAKSQYRFIKAADRWLTRQSRRTA